MSPEYSVRIKKVCLRPAADPVASTYTPPTIHVPVARSIFMFEANTGHAREQSSKQINDLTYG